MAINDVVWKNGTAEVIESTGSDITVYWKDGTAYVQHEYEASIPEANIPVLMHHYTKNIG